MTIDKILLATGNPGKVRELRRRLEQTPIEVVGLGDEGVKRPEQEVPETADTFRDNAILKAVGYGQYANMITLADDSGLVVDALKGEPGVYSARWSGEDATDEKNNALLLERLEGIEHRNARFKCVVVLYIPPGIAAEVIDPIKRTLANFSSLILRPTEDEGWIIYAHGKTEGHILYKPRGRKGFGYDPLFWSDDLGVSFAEATIDEKSTVSHRGRALNPICDFLTLHAERMAEGAE